MSVLNVNKDNFDSVRTSEKTVLLDFYADWCGPCRMVSPVVEEIAAENPQYLIGKVNVDKRAGTGSEIQGLKHSHTRRNQKRERREPVGRRKAESRHPCLVKGLIVPQEKG